MYLRKNCAQLVQSNSAAHAGNSRPLTLAKSSPCANGRLTLPPFPGAWFELGGERVKLLAATPVAGSGAPGEVIDDALTVACGNGALRPALLQRAGKSPMAVADFLRGFPVACGTILS